MDRRAFLARLTGGSLALVFPWSLGAQGEQPAAELDETERWETLGAVQGHLFPSEPEVPGAREINALGYLRFAMSEPGVDAEERAFIAQGVHWLADLAQRREGGPFPGLDAAARERVLREVATTEAGENWLSTLLTYLFEALLSDPVYGGNPDGVGWKWLSHTPGFPRPTPDKRYWLLGS